MAILLLILHLSIFLLGSGINRKSSTNLTLVAAAKEGKNNNNNNNNPVLTNVKCWKGHAVVTPNSWNNSLKSGQGRNIAANSKNINTLGRRGGSSNINITSRSSNIAADDSIIISGSLSERGSQQRKVDLVRDLVVTLNSNDSNQELPADVTDVLVDTTEALMVSGTQNINININNSSSSDIAADNDSNSNMRTTEQAVPTEGQDLPTTMKQVESEQTNKELVIGTWNIQSGRSTRLETALRALSILGVDLCFLVETKLTNSMYTQFSLGYRILATNAMSHHQGGVALVYRESSYCQVKSSVLHGSNVISAVIVSWNSQYGIVGAYIPPADTTTSIHITTALGRFPNQKVILMGDLNLDLDLNLNSIEKDRDMEIADVLATSRLLNIHRHFKSARRCRRPATWHQKLKGKVVKSRPDYFLCSD